jgi:hypothetical protein
MASSKSRQKKRKNQQKPGQQSIERLKRKLEQEPLGDVKFVVEPQGQVKMSDVLERFAEPYLDFAETAEDYRKLFTVAALAWNAAFLPPSEQEKMVDDILGARVPADSGELKKGLTEIVGALIARKQALFADNTRKIVNLELTETASGFHLSVASTL